MKGPNVEFLIREWKRDFRNAGGNTNSVEFQRALKEFRRDPLGTIARSRKAPK